ncbi:hypothetical protein [Nonomuraea endophytica]|uniref:hypothetical protein n=1 Tax=Nonomuraea endophytica TaxID=714136 RepID=UPI0037C88572
MSLLRSGLTVLSWSSGELLISPSSVRLTPAALLHYHYEQTTVGPNGLPTYELTVTGLAVLDQDGLVLADLPGEWEGVSEFAQEAGIPVHTALPTPNEGLTGRGTPTPTPTPTSTPTPTRDEGLTGGRTPTTPTPIPTRNESLTGGGTPTTPTPAPTRDESLTGGGTPTPTRDESLTGGSTPTTPTPAPTRDESLTGGSTPTPTPTRDESLTGGSTPTPTPTRDESLTGGSTRNTPAARVRAMLAARAPGWRRIVGVPPAPPAPWRKPVAIGLGVVALGIMIYLTSTGFWYVWRGFSAIGRLLIDVVEVKWLIFLFSPLLLFLAPVRERLTRRSVRKGLIVGSTGGLHLKLTSGTLYINRGPQTLSALPVAPHHSLPAPTPPTSPAPSPPAPSPPAPTPPAATPPVSTTPVSTTPVSTTPASPATSTPASPAPSRPASSPRADPPPSPVGDLPPPPAAAAHNAQLPEAPAPSTPASPAPADPPPSPAAAPNTLPSGTSAPADPPPAEPVPGLWAVPTADAHVGPTPDARLEPAPDAQAQSNPVDRPNPLDRLEPEGTAEGFAARLFLYRYRDLAGLVVLAADGRPVHHLPGPWSPEHVNRFAARHNLPLEIRTLTHDEYLALTTQSADATT